MSHNIPDKATADQIMLRQCKKKARQMQYEVR
jgi:hypothetical protein